MGKKEALDHNLDENVGLVTVEGLWERKIAAMKLIRSRAKCLDLKVWNQVVTNGKKLKVSCSFHYNFLDS